MAYIGFIWRLSIIFLNFYRLEKVMNYFRSVIYIENAKNT